MQYIPNTVISREMLEKMGLESIEELFSDIPERARIKETGLAAGKTDIEVSREVGKISAMNKNTCEFSSFLGGGVYHHFVPPVVEALVTRSEFYTAYTPYQAEVSQGMLQALFEYQTMISELTGMEVTNSSMYDWSTALAEAALMSMRVNRGEKFVVPSNVSPRRLSVLQSYAEICGFSVEVIPHNSETGEIDVSAMVAASENAAGIYVETPNYFGVIDKNIPELKAKIGKALLVVGVNPLSLGVLRSPGSYGADIVIGEGQVFGQRLNFGGPLLGIFSTSKKHYRKMPGRLIGLTTDVNGETAYIMTAQTREQHIRRAKATSNICSNEALCALTAVVYLSLQGPSGLKELALLNMKSAKYLKNKLLSYGAKEVFSAPVFNEFVIDVGNSDIVLEKLRNNNVLGGIKIDDSKILVCATEMNTREDMDKYADTLKNIMGVEQ